MPGFDEWQSCWKWQKHSESCVINSWNDYLYSVPTLRTVDWFEIVISSISCLTGNSIDIVQMKFINAYEMIIDMNIQFECCF